MESGSHEIQGKLVAGKDYTAQPRPRPSKIRTVGERTLQKHLVQKTLGDYGFDTNQLIKENYFKYLPKDLQEFIFQHLTVGDVVNFTNSSKEILNIFKSYMMNKGYKTRVEVSFFTYASHEEFEHIEEDDPYEIYIDLKWSTFQELNAKLNVIKNHFSGKSFGVYEESDTLRWDGIKSPKEGDHYPLDIVFDDLFVFRFSVLFLGVFDATEIFNATPGFYGEFEDNTPYDILGDAIEEPIDDLDKHVTWDYTEITNPKLLLDNFVFLLYKKDNMTLEQTEKLEKPLLIEESPEARDIRLASEASQAKFLEEYEKQEWQSRQKEKERIRQQKKDLELFEQQSKKHERKLKHRIQGEKEREMQRFSDFIQKPSQFLPPPEVPHFVVREGEKPVEWIEQTVKSRQERQMYKRKKQLARKRQREAQTEQQIEEDEQLAMQLQNQ